jgi:FSR family fosmidomycin resistance protein-like MFS transporter
MRGTAVLIPIAFAYSLLLYWLLGRADYAQDVREAKQQAANGENSIVRLVLVVLAVMCLSWFQGSFRTYLPIWSESQGHSAAVAGRMLTVFLATMGVGSLVGGASSDRIGRWQLLALSLLLLGPAVWFFIGATGPMQWGWLMLMGVLMGATFPVSIVMAQEAWSRRVGVASGLAMGVGWLPGGIGASLTGMIADRFSLEVGLRTLVLPALIGTVCVLAYASTRRKSLDERGEPVLV